jgi:protein phosphatase
MSIELSCAGRTDVGVERDHNEDAIHVGSGNQLFIVADGMGGHSSGDVASSLAIETIASAFSDTPLRMDWPYRGRGGKSERLNKLKTSIKLANRKIFNSSEQQGSEDRDRMGTTVVALHADHKRIYTAYVGDSRIYRFRDRQLVQVSDDHSLLNDYKQMKGLADNEVQNFPYKNVIVRALGMDRDVSVDTHYESPNNGDIYLLCSDGLNDEVSDDDIADILDTHTDLETAADMLIEAARDSGGKDNISVVLVSVETT